MKTHTEHAFESTVKQMLLARGNLAEWDKERALFPPALWRYIAATQGDIWGQLRAQHDDGKYGNLMFEWVSRAVYEAIAKMGAMGKAA